jgi:hypothetical protein
VNDQTRSFGKSAEAAFASSCLRPVHGSSISLHLQEPVLNRLNFYKMHHVSSLKCDMYIL